MDSLSSFRSDQIVEGSARSGSGLAKGLGWYSLALGAAELIAPRLMAEIVGADPKSMRTRALLRACGLREIVSGIAVLAQPHRPMPLWFRVAGDALDLSLLGATALNAKANGLRVAGSTAAVLGVTALDVIAAKKTQAHYNAANQPVIFSVTINKPVAEVYAFYRKLDNLPRFMDFLESIEVRDERRSHWIAKLPVGGTVSWEAEITEDRPNELIRWQSVNGSVVKTEGEVMFSRTPGRDMTEVRVKMKLGFTGVGPSVALAKLFAKPQMKGDLRRLKQVLETGEVLRSDASAHVAPHPAQPSKKIDKPAPDFYIANSPTATKGVSTTVDSPQKGASS